jgi:hypothetical protein
MIRTTALLLLVASLAWAQAPDLVGTWTNEGGSFEFNADGSVRMTVGAQSQTGYWTIQGQQLGLSLHGGQMLFVFQQEGDQLLLADANGQYLLQRVSAPRAEPPSQPPLASGPALTERQFLGLIEHFESMKPDDVYDHLLRTTDDQKQMIQIHGALEQALCHRACQGGRGRSLVWPTMMVTMDCQRVADLRAEHLQLFGSMGLGGDPFLQAKTEQLQLVNHYQCLLGIHSPEVCASSYQTQSDVSRMQHETSMEIIDNMGTAGCTEYWEEDGAGNRTYLGCW